MTLPRVHVQMDRAALGRGRAVETRHEAGRPPSVVVVEFNAVEATVEYVDQLEDDQEGDRPDGTA